MEYFRVANERNAKRTRAVGPCNFYIIITIREMWSIDFTLFLCLHCNSLKLFIIAIVVLFCLWLKHFADFLLQ